MAETTNIAWTDSTFNPWWGCQKVSPGCDHCYAEALDRRTGGRHWGIGTMPRRTGGQNWNQPLRWNRHAATSGHPHRVFCASMADWCDLRVPDEWRSDLWDLIRATPHLTWQLLTKRAPNLGRCLPGDWGDGYKNVWLGITVVNQEEAARDIPRLLGVPAKVRWLSLEPLLGPVDLSPWLDLYWYDDGDVSTWGWRNSERPETGLAWVVVGGESGTTPRMMEPNWVEEVYAQCRAAGLPFFFKQWGGRTDKGGCLLDGVEVKQWPAE
jgi:protein gp37